MVAQYFKRKRELVEIFIVSGSGLGIVCMSTFIKSAIEAIGWRFVVSETLEAWLITFQTRLGLQAVTICVFSTFILGTCYRSASLYHPQRRAILHLKNQKRKIKDKSKQFDGPPFFDFSTLKSKTVRILMLSTAITWDDLGKFFAPPHKLNRTLSFFPVHLASIPRCFTWPTRSPKTS